MSFVMNVSGVTLLFNSAPPWLLDQCPQHYKSAGRRLESMYLTTRNISGDTLVACSDCGHEVSMNRICRTPIQSAANRLSHMAAHKVSGALVPVALIVSKVGAVGGFGSKGMSA